MRAALSTQSCRDVGIENLDRHMTIGMRFSRKVDHPHPTPSQFALQAITLQQRLLEFLQTVGHLDRCRA